MEFFFNPQAVAVVGASPNPYKGGHAILMNLISGFTGKIFPVNPNYPEIEGLRCYQAITEIPGKIDLAIIFVPAQQVLPVVEQCVLKGIPGVIIESSGFAETGPEGRARQEKLADIARRTGMRIWGPNCMGIVDVPKKRAFSFMHPAILKEILSTNKISLIVQSGMLSAGFLLDVGSNSLMGISKACSIGNKVDVNENDILDYLIDDPETDVIALYLESFTDGRRFVELCRRSTKPIVLLKGGKSPQGAQAALSHTASLAGNYRLTRDILEQVNVVEAHEFKQMMDIARSLSRYPRLLPPGRKKAVAILTFSGGAGILACDFLNEFELKLAEFTPETREKIAAFFPAWMPVANPVDLWPAIEKNGPDFDVYSPTLEAILADEEVGAVFIHTVAGAFRISFELENLARLAHQYDKPVFIWVMGRRNEVFSLQKEATQRGLLTFPDLYRAVECLATSLNYQASPPGAVTCNRDSLQLSPETERTLTESCGSLDEYSSKRILKEAGIPTVQEKIISDEDDIEWALAELGEPLVLKGLRPGIIHKTEHGLVRMNLAGREAVRQSFRKLRERMGDEGRVLIQKQLNGNRELIAGYLRDREFGPCVMLGLGGLLTEIIADRVFAAAPLTPREALAMMERLKAKKIFDHFRGSPPVDRKELAEILVTLGTLGAQYPRIEAIDINPLIICEGKPIAVDASIILAPGPFSPSRL